MFLMPNGVALHLSWYHLMCEQKLTIRIYIYTVAPANHTPCFSAVFNHAISTAPSEPDSVDEWVTIYSHQQAGTQVPPMQPREHLALDMPPQPEGQDLTGMPHVRDWQGYQGKVEIYIIHV